MPDAIEKSTDTAKRAAETVADATRRGAEIASNVGERIVGAVRGTADTVTGATRRTADAAGETAQRATDEGRDAIVSGLRAMRTRKARSRTRVSSKAGALSRSPHELPTCIARLRNARPTTCALFDSWMSLGRGLQQWQQPTPTPCGNRWRAWRRSGRTCSRPFTGAVR